jgi:hypothetical protein
VLEQELCEVVRELSGVFVSLARIYDMVAAGSHPAADHPMPAGSCYSYSPGVVEQAWSLPANRRDFTHTPEVMLRWVESRSGD